MDVDSDILKTLESIEKLLKSSSALTENKKLPTSAARAQQTSSQRAGKDANKAFKATATNLKSTNEAVIGLSKSLVGLNTEVGKTTTGFGSLNSQMARFMASLTPLSEPTTPTTPATRAPDITGWLQQLVTATGSMIAGGAAANGLLAQIARNTAGPAATAATTVTPAVPTPPVPTPAPAPIKPTAPAVPPAANSIIGKMLQQFSKAATMLGALSTVGAALSQVVQKLTGDFFTLAQVGLGSTENLYNLSKYALQSGMSLKEYQTVISQNIAAASRAGSLENFQKTISAADAQLADMGIFGQQARQFQASLAQSSTMMGVTQGNLTDAISAQIKVFDDLRKSTNMTSDEFAGLIKDLSNNEQVQKELVGLAPQQRMARRAELLQLTTIGQRMGLAADASKQLGDALLKQREQTVKNRVEQSGRIRQLAQLTGQGAEGERAAQIIMKGRAATADELDELRTLVGSIDKSAQGAYEFSSMGFQSAIDDLDEMLSGTSVGGIMKANRPAELAQDSGKVNNADFGKHVGEFGKLVGQLTTWWRGFEQSIGPAIFGAIAGAGALFFKGPIIKGIQGMISMGAGAAGAVGATGAAAGTAAAAGATGAAATAGAAATSGKTLIQTITGLGSALTSSLPSISGAITNWRNASSLLGPVVATISSGLSGATMILNGLKAFTKAFGAAALVIDPLIELFTGNISEALNPEGGFIARVGGIVTSFFTAIPNMFFDIAAFIFGDKALARIRNSFDTIVSYMNMAFKEFLGSLVGGAAGLLAKILPKDSKLVKFLDSAAEGLFDSALQNQKVGEELWADNSKTLKSVSAANAKSAEETAKKAEAATTKATAAQKQFNNVQYGMALNRDSLIQDAKAILGQPQVQAAPQVGATTVNKTDETDATGTKKADKAVAALGGPEVMAALNAILTVMQNSLLEEKRTADLTEQLVKGNRPTATFEDAVNVANRVLTPRMMT